VFRVAVATMHDEFEKTTAGQLKADKSGTSLIQSEIEIKPESVL